VDPDGFTVNIARLGDDSGMRIVIAGGSGFLGRNLRARLNGDGHDVVRLVRRPADGADQRQWHPDRGELDPDVLAGADVVINLAGAGVGDKRWNARYRQTLVDSRVQPTGTLARTLATMDPQKRPGVLLNSSAIGFYGDTGDTEVDETSPAGSDFFAGLCQSWEDATTPAEAAGVRVVHLRSGLVLHRRGGLLAPMLFPFYLGIGGPLAGGRQWMPCISLDDWRSAVVFLMSHGDIAGPVNLVGPQPVRNKDFAKALGRAVHRPAIAPVPKFALRILLGEFADDGAVMSSRVLPGVLQQAGFGYVHPDLDSILRASFDRS
jgi:uncharacterized protein (TIGR01777 family)